MSSLPRGGAPVRVRRLDGAAIAGVMSREWTVFSRYWRSATFSAVVEPTIYLLAFGFGFGALVSRIGGYDYVDFVGTGTVATAALFASVFPAMFGTLYKRRYQRTYDAILAAPVDVEELVSAEVLWIAAKAGVYGMAPLLVAVAFGLQPGPTVVLVPLIALLTGLGFACLGMAIAGVVQSFDNFSYVTSALITPLFLVAGTFFPLTGPGMPAWANVAGQFNPLHHCVELVRHAVFGLHPAVDLAHAGALVLFALVGWRVAIWRLRVRLID